MPVRLQERDERILLHVRRYRITVPEVLKRLFFAEQSDEAMKSTLKRLRRPDAPMIASTKLYPRGNQVYYHLAPAGAVHVGLTEKSSHPLTDHETLVRTLGQLLFCCAGDRPRPKFTPVEFDRAFPEMRIEGSSLFRRFPYDAYFLDVDDSGTRRLGRILVDNGGSEILFRARTVVREDQEVLDRFVREDRYALALVVSSVSKAEQLRRQLATRPLSEGPPLRTIVEAHDALVGLLAGSP